jgi:hypothetical protein
LLFFFAKKLSPVWFAGNALEITYIQRISIPLEIDIAPVWRAFENPAEIFPGTQIHWTSKFAGS